MDGWHKGLRRGKYRAELPARCAIEMNILGVPTCSLNPRHTKNASQISYGWKTPEGDDALFTFSRTGEDPFPTAQHAMYLDILLAMFANNFNPDGVLKFKFSDVLRNAGRPVTSAGARTAIKEAIRRYHTCHALWKYSFKGAQQSTWSGSFITQSTLLEDEAKHLVRNPRNTLDNEKWHTVRFHHLIVESMTAGNVRLFYCEMLQSGLKHDTYIVYRYFRRFTDISEIKRSLQQLMMAFNYQSKRMDRFKVWLSERLYELQDANYVQTFVIHSDWASVKLTTVKANGTARPTKAMIGELVGRASF